MGSTARFTCTVLGHTHSFTTTLRAACDTSAAWDAVAELLTLSHSRAAPSAVLAGTRAHRFVVELSDREHDARPAGTLTVDVVRVSR